MNERYIWPEGKRCAAMISVNLDAEFYGKIFYPDTDIDLESGEIQCHGRISIEDGLPRLLDTLDAYGVRATFFIPGEVARRYPEAAAEVARRDHEIGSHGMKHELMAHLSADEQRQVLRESRAVLREITGREAAGFRMPEGEITEETLRIAREEGYVYSSSLSDDDVPYFQPESGMLELPIHWQLFDLPFFTFAFDPPIPPGQARSAEMDYVLQNWLYELEGARHWGTLMNVQLDPQTIGEQGRIFMLEKLLDAIREAGDVWLATGSEIAEAYSKKH